MQTAQLLGQGGTARPFRHEHDDTCMSPLACAAIEQLCPVMVSLKKLGRVVACAPKTADEVSHVHLFVVFDDSATTGHVGRHCALKGFMKRIEVLIHKRKRMLIDVRGSVLAVALHVQFSEPAQ